MRATTDWKHLSEEASKDRRRERRIRLTFPIEVSGFDRSGRYFSERTLTSDVSQSGCRFHLKSEVECSTVVAIKLVTRETGMPRSGRPLLFQVVRAACEKDGWSVGASSLQPENLWCVAFPSPQEQLTPVA